MAEFRRVQAVTNLETLICVHNGHGEILGYEVQYPDGRVVPYDEHVQGMRSMSALDQAEINLQLRLQERDEAYAALDDLNAKLDAQSERLDNFDKWIESAKRRVPTLASITVSVSAIALLLVHVVR